MQLNWWTSWQVSGSETRKRTRTRSLPMTRRTSRRTMPTATATDSSVCRRSCRDRVYRRSGGAAKGFGGPAGLAPCVGVLPAHVLFPWFLSLATESAISSCPLGQSPGLERACRGCGRCLACHGRGCASENESGGQRESADRARVPTATRTIAHRRKNTHESQHRGFACGPSACPFGLNWMRLLGADCPLAWFHSWQLAGP